MENNNTRHALFMSLILHFSELAEKCIGLLYERYDFDIHPNRARQIKLLPPKGNFDFSDGTLEYSFHGDGCCFLLNDMEIDFNFNSEGSFRGFGIYTLSNFARTLDDYSIFSDRNLVEEYLNKFIQEGIIKNVNPPYPLYKIKG